ncbi:MAG: Hsp33 family molecular chaperone [Pseudomonadota bacterium]
MNSGDDTNLQPDVGAGTARSDMGAGMTSEIEPGNHALNRVLPFAVEDLDLRGKAVTLTTEFDAIVSRHNYPDEINRALGEAIALGALLGTTLKFDGKFILQTQSDGVLDIMVVEFRTPSDVRAYARFDEERLAAAIAANKAAPKDLLGEGILVMTVDQGEHMQRYQGIVQLDGVGLEEIADRYFRQSEQIPTVVRLAVGQLYAAEAQRPVWRAGGLMAQFLPESEDRMRLRDLHGGDGAPEDDGADEDDAWTEAVALVGTVEDDELLDPEITSERLLVRLFNQYDTRVFEGLPIRDKCSCTRERLAQVIDRMEPEEQREIAVDGKITAKCEFCAKAYDFEVAA